MKRFLPIFKKWKFIKSIFAHRKNIEIYQFICRNELERLFLEMLQFNINVPSSVYAKYYFDLRTMAEANEMSFPSVPLSKERALKLEAMTQNSDDKLTQEILQTGFKRWSSLDKLSVNRRSIAILS